MTKTVGEVYGPAMEITDLDKASAYFENLVIEAMNDNPNFSRRDAELQEQANLKCYAAHCSDEIYDRMVQLFIRKRHVYIPESEANKAFEIAASLAEVGPFDIGCSATEAEGVVRRTRDEIAKGIRKLKE